MASDGAGTIHGDSTDLVGVASDGAGTTHGDSTDSAGVASDGAGMPAGDGTIGAMQVSGTAVSEIVTTITDFTIIEEVSPITIIGLPGPIIGVGQITAIIVRASIGLRPPGVQLLEEAPIRMGEVAQQLHAIQ